MRARQIFLSMSMAIIMATGTLVIHAGEQIDFETFPNGDPIPPDTQLTDQFVSEGVLFEPHSGSGYSAVVYTEGMHGLSNFGNTPIRVVNIGYWNETTRIRFVHPEDATQRLVRHISILVGDGDPSSETVRFSAFDQFDGQLCTATQTTIVEGYRFDCKAADWEIAYVALTLLATGESGAGFDDLDYDWPIEPGSTPGDVPDLRVDDHDSETGKLTISYEPTCAATNHTIQYGRLEDVSGYEYAGQDCGIGDSGEYSGFNPGAYSYFFLIVGNDGAYEGSYGEDSLRMERPRYDTAPTCPYSQQLPDRCDIEPPG